MSEERSFSYYLKPIIFGVLVSVILTAVLLLVFSLILTKIDFSLSAINPVMIALCGISVFAGSFIVSRTVRQRGLFLGLCIGLLYFILMLILSASVSPMGLGLDAVWKFLSSVISGILGGILGVNSNKRALI